MASDPLQSRADALAARIDALAAALHTGGVADETCERLLARASAAALHALTLELLVEQADQPIFGELPPHTARPPGFLLAA